MRSLLRLHFQSCFFRDADDEEYISTTTTTEVNEDQDTTTFFDKTLDTSTNQGWYFFKLALYLLSLS